MDSPESWRKVGSQVNWKREDRVFIEVTLRNVGETPALAAEGEAEISFIDPDDPRKVFRYDRPIRGRGWAAPRSGTTVMEFNFIDIYTPNIWDVINRSPRIHVVECTFRWRTFFGKWSDEVTCTLSPIGDTEQMFGAADAIGERRDLIVRRDQIQQRQREDEEPKHG